MDGIETSLRRPHLGRREKVEKVLEAIPYNRWVSTTSRTDRKKGSLPIVKDYLEKFQQLPLNT